MIRALQYFSMISAGIAAVFNANDGNYMIAAFCMFLVAWNVFNLESAWEKKDEQ